MIWDRRALIVLVGFVLASGLGCVPHKASHVADESKACYILQLNDVYRIEGIENGSKGGLARIRQLRQDLEREAPVLVMHAGDLLFPSVMSKHFQAKAMVETLNLLDGNPDQRDDRLIVTLGNHEFDEDGQTLIDRLSESEFDWVTSNVFYVPEGGQPEPFSKRLKQVHATRMIEIAGMRIGIFGITLDDYQPDFVSIDYDEQVPLGTLPSVSKALAELKAQKLDVLVALTHQEMAMDERLACEVPDIDLIVGGHEHIALEAKVCETPIHKADADAISVWVHKLTINPDGKLTIFSEKQLIDEETEKDPGIETLTDQWLERLADEIPDYNHVYGETENLLEGLEPLIRSRETAMGNWLTDLARQRWPTELAIIHGGSIRINDNIPAGSTIRGEHLAGIFYYDINMVLTKVNGRELLAMLQQSVANVDRGEGAFLQISGFRFEFRKKAGVARGFEVVPGTVAVLKGTRTWQALDLDRDYTLALPRYLWKNGYRDGYELFSNGNGGTSPPLISEDVLDLRAEVERSLAGERLVRAKLDGRIRFVE